MILLAHVKRYCLLPCLLLVIVSSFALIADKRQPYRISSEKVTFLQNTHRSIFSGDVVVTQGSSRITATTLTLYLDEDNKVVRYFVAKGAPATFITELDGKKQNLNAQADIIKYYPESRLVILEKNAVINQAGNEIRGAYMTYDLEKQVITSSSTQKNNKTTITIQPKKG